MACRASVFLPCVALVALASLASLVGRVDAIGVRSPVPVAVRARLDIRVVSDEASLPPGDILSRSPADLSRFMADATVGNSAMGRAYIKGAASWSETDDALGRVAFRVEQGEYHYAWRDAPRVGVELRAFGDERRFFTGELGTALVEDDEAERFEHRIGARIDGARRAAGVSYLAAGLDDGVAVRVLQMGTARVAGRHAFASFSYLHNAPERGDDHAIAKAEAAAHVSRATAVLSYEQAGFGSGAFLPSGSWESWEAGYDGAAPDNSATFAELRASRIAIGSGGWIAAAARYSLVGAEYVDDLSARRPGTETREAWLDWSHRRYAVDTRLEFRDESRFRTLDASRRSLAATTRAFLRDNYDALIRGGLLRSETTFVSRDAEGFVHVGFGRSLQRFSGRVHAMVDHIGTESVASAGAEARVNWSATGALYARWIVRDAAPRTQSVYARLEFRPTRRTWFTIGYGRDAVGDGPYFLEDSDLPPTPDSDDVFTLIVRGDL